jgi:co-chaperonin GroES (HSP10)
VTTASHERVVVSAMTTATAGGMIVTAAAQHDPMQVQP